MHYFIYIYKKTNVSDSAVVITEYTVCFFIQGYTRNTYSGIMIKLCNSRQMFGKKELT